MKARLLPALASKQVGAYALSEAGSGSDAFALTTRAREDGDSS
jgi:alkylation response protein AidB-like acyl-CoA dehydrogenase